MIEAKFIDTDNNDWLGVSRETLGQRSPIESQRRSVGVCRENVKLLVLDIHALDQSVCFESIKVLVNVVIVGFGETVHFFDVLKLTGSSKKMDGYFGGMYTPEDFGLKENVFQILVASASHLHRFTSEGEEMWKSSEVGIDGVIVQEVTSSKIRVSGEWDPPGGWENAELRLKDGANAN